MATERLKTFLRLLKKNVKTLNVLKKGQKKSYEILQTAHRIEKGLCVENPKPLWGWEKAQTLRSLINEELKESSADIFAVTCAVSVLGKYIESKLNSKFPEDVEKANQFIIPHKELFDASYGGTAIVGPHEYDPDADFLGIINNRHSIRTFEDREINVEDLKKAVELANRCPSACNRQPYKVYVIDAEKKKNAIGSESNFNANKFLIITGIIDAFSINEQNDWLISSSIFAAYLTLTLQYYGIDACVMRKELVSDVEYNKKISKLCNMGSNEQIVLELAIGYCKEATSVPVSRRKDVTDLIVIV